LNVEISSPETRISLRNNVRLTPLDKAEIVARSRRGQPSDELAAMFGVARRTINRIVRAAQSPAQQVGS
jgi:hypothetical protein